MSHPNLSPWETRRARLHDLATRLGSTPAAQLVALAVLTRIVIVLVAWLAGSTFPQDIAGWNRGPGFIRYFARWDSGFYMDIAELGYGFKPEGWAFNPGYPIVLWLVWRLVPGIDLPTAGFIVSNAAFLVAVPLFYKLGRAWFDERTAWRAAAFVAVFPGSFYFSAVYADALFFLLVVGAFLAIHHHRWLLAGALVSYAAITRPPGLFLTAALGLAVLLHVARTRRLDWRPLSAVPIAAILPGLFLLYSWRVTGDPLISTRVREVYWPNVQWHDPLTLFDLAGVAPAFKALMVGGMFVVLLTMVFCLADLAVRRRFELLPVYAFTLVLGVVYIGYSEPNPIVRYLITLIPLYWMLAWVSAHRGVFIGLVAASAWLGGFVTIVFATWGPLY